MRLEAGSELVKDYTAFTFAILPTLQCNSISSCQKELYSWGPKPISISWPGNSPQLPPWHLPRLITFTTSSLESIHRSYSLVGSVCVDALPPLAGATPALVHVQVAVRAPVALLAAAAVRVAVGEALAVGAGLLGTVVNLCAMSSYEEGGNQH